MSTIGPSDNRPARPRLALRVGVTGARSLDAGRLDYLRGQLRMVLEMTRMETERLAAEPAIAAAYEHADGPAPEPVLRLLSPLARGADRLGAEVGLELGYALDVPMPFPQAEYEKDFTGSEKDWEPTLSGAEDLAQFRALLRLADKAWFALDGDHGAEMNRAYEAVGRFVVRHCDLLIAIWDGKPASGRGGTGDIVRFAASVGVPVWWIAADGEGALTWIADIQDLRDPEPTPGNAEQELREHLKRLISPPRPVERHRDRWFERLAQRGLSAHVSPQADYLEELPLPHRRIWRIYPTLMRWASGLNPPWSPPHRPGGDQPVAAYWFDRYAPANARAGEYAVRYRSSYVWIFALGISALLFGALALGLGAFETPGDRIPLPWLAASLSEKGVTLAMVGMEFVALAAIFALVVIATRRDWHERSIEYRLLAELCRKQQALAPLGWALSVGSIQRTIAADRAAWVAWLFAAYQRAAPLPQGDVASALPGARRKEILGQFIEEQLDYHHHRSKMAKRAGERLVKYGGASFLLVVALVVVKLVMVTFEWSHSVALVLAMAAIVLPGASAAFIGVRDYAELQLLAEQSRHMEAELKRAKLRLERLNLSRPLASQDLGAEAALVAMLMLQDLEGWTRLFRAKAVEPGA